MRDPRALADPERSNIELDGEDAVQRPPSVPSQAAEAGYSEGALYWHFASREEVLLALLEERVDAPMREMVALLESAPPDRDMSVEAAREFARQLRDQREAVVGVRLSMRASVWTPCLIRHKIVEGRYSLTRPRPLRLDAVLPGRSARSSSPSCCPVG